MLKRLVVKNFTYLTLLLLMVFSLFSCKKVEFKIDFIVDGSVYATVKTNGEEVVKMPTDPQKEGYEFDGWYWDNNSWKKSFTANSLLDAPLSSNMSVYAKWTTQEQVKGTQAEFEGFDKISETEYSMKVANSIETLSLSELVTVNSRSSWTLSTDIYGNQTIASKIATLVAGDNTYYVLVKAENGSTQLYTLKIRRRPIYNVIFDTTGGIQVENQKVEEDSFASAPTTTKKGYTFVSWNYDFNEPITENKVIVAEWKDNNYRINYDANGGELDNKYTDVSYDAVYKLPIPTKKGYDFCGWYSGEDLVNDGVYKNVGDINLKASWKAINYKITYDLKGGSLIKTNPSSYTIESNNIILNNPTKLGYEFIGWTGTDISKPSKGVIIYSNSTGDRTYTANWEFSGYKINYHLNGGINDENNPIGFTIASENIYLKNPTKEGYIFGGWYKNEFFSADSKVTMIPTGSTGDIDIYAKWTPITYSVKFNANGGSGVMNNQLFTYDIEQNLDENKYTRTGYTFLGWSNSKNDIVSKYTDKATVVNLGNEQGDLVEFYAIWKANTNKITFNKGISEGGTDEVIAIYDLSMPEANAPTIPFGYKFDGYFDEDGTQYYSSTMASLRKWDQTEDTILYARFIAKEVAITFDMQGGNDGSTSVNATYDAEMPKAIAPKKAGYDFVGYFYQENGKGTKYYDSNMKSVHNWDRDYDATLYAYYTPSKFTISFNFNGGECEEESTSVTYLEALPDLTKIPTRAGYSFVGYFDAKLGGTKYYDSTLAHTINYTKTSSVTLYARWSAITYEIKFDGNGATSGNMANEEFVYDTAKKLTTNTYSKLGYEFIGWNTERDGNGTNYSNNESILNITTKENEEVVLYAQWKVVEYSITYNLNGGTNNKLNPNKYTIEDAITLLSPTKEGYTFAGWTNNGQIKKGTTGTLTFTASWTANMYTITFDKKGGENGSNTVTATYNSAMPTATAPEYRGYDFEGYFDKDGTQYYSSTMSSLKNWDKVSSATLYARYKAKTYNVTFDKQNGTGGTNNVQATYNLAMPKGVAPTRVGYTFGGYFDETNGRGTKYYSNTMSSLSNWNKAFDAVLYAYWIPNTYTVKFSANGGEGLQANVTATYDSTMPSIAVIPTKTGYSFIGYYDSTSGGNKYYNADLTSANKWDKTSSVTLYARWSAITYEIKFDGNGATSGNMANEEFVYDTAKKLTTNTYSKLGYEFVGWNTERDGNGTNYSNNESILNIITKENEEVVLYAKWKANSYTVTLDDTRSYVEPTYTVSFNLNGAKGSVDSQTITTTKGLTYPSIPTRSDYLFGGWYTTSSCTTLFDFTAPVTQDTTVYAKWVSYSGYGTLKVGENSGSITFPSRNSSNYRYYAFVPLVTGSVTIYSSSSSDTYGYLFNSSKSQLTSNDDGGSGSNFSITYNVTAGKLYYIVACAYSSSSSCTGTIYIKGTSTPSTGGKVVESSVNPITQTVTYDSAFTLSTNCTKEGYTFAGWYDGVNGTGIQYTDKQGNSVRNWDKTSNTTLYAKWIAYTFTTNKNIVNAGTITEFTNMNITAGTSKTITATTNAGYTWIGWYNGDELLTNDLSYTFNMPENNITYTARWSVNKYTITFNSNGGSSVDSITQDYGTKLNAPTKPTLAEKSFVGWFDSTLSTEYTFTTVEARDITLYAKWVDYEVTLSCTKRTEISVNDLIEAETFNGTAIDTDGNPVEVTAEILSGTKTVGNNITVRLIARGLYDIYAAETISNINIYGAPMLTYNNQKDYIKMSDTINAALFNATAVDTLENALTVNVSVKEGTYKAGDLVTIVISTTDKTGNETKVEIENVKVYGTPIITRNVEVVDIKETDTISNELFGASAVDSFGEFLNVTTIKYRGTLSGGNTITIKSSATDSKGNTNYIMYSIKVYGTPSISSASTTSFKVSDDITLDTLGITAKDSFGNTLTNITIKLTSGTQIAGATLTYLVTATDHLGNVNTREITDIKIYGTPTISYDTEKDAMKVTDTIDSSLFSAIAKDSFNDSLSVNVELNSGTFAGGNIVTFKLSTIDVLGNTYEIVSQNIKVYSSDDIVLTYTTSATNIKKASIGEEFNATAVNSFGETCVTSIEAASGYTLAGGNIINLYIVATDALGNTTKSELISNIKVYDIPTLVYTRDYPYIQNGDSPYALFQVLDSFGNELLFNVETVSGSLDVNETITYRITATDKVKNNISVEYTLVVLDTEESILELYRDGVKVGTQRVYKNGNFMLPYYDGYDVVWYYNGTAITNNRGVSLTEWDKNSNGYIVSTNPITITYSITYTLNGGTNNLNNKSSYNIESSDITVYEPTRAGYTFTGWTGTDVIEPTKTLVITTGHFGNRTFIANWQANNYTITFDANGGNVNVNSQIVTFDATYTLPTPTRTGYTFVGWFNGDTKYNGGTWTTASNITLTAKWTANTNTIYTVNHYLQNIENDEYSFYEAQTLRGTSDTSVSPSVKNYTGFTAPAVQTVNVNPDGSRVVNYYYTRNYYTITVVGNGGSNNTIRQKYQSAINTTGWTTRDGYTLGGLYTDLALSTLYTDTTMPAQNKTVYAYWEGENVATDFTYTSTTSGITITGYTGNSTIVKIPAQIGGKNVIAIASSAFANKTSITSIVVPNSVTSIGAGAFKGCSSLVSISVPFVGASRTASNYSAVFGYIFGYVETSGSSWYTYCTGSDFANESYSISGTTWQFTCIPTTRYDSSSYPYHAKYYNYYIPSSITTVTITDATSIPTAAFNGCSNITSIVLNDEVTTIGNYAFQNCTKLESADVGTGLTTLNSYAFYNCSALKAITIPSGTTSIATYAFYGNIALANVTLPSSMTTINSYAFYNTTSLKELVFPTELKTIGDYAFYGTRIRTLNIPSKLTSIGSYAFDGDVALTSLTIPGNVKTIGSYAFSGCANITSLTLNSGIQSIGSYAFQNLKITTATVPNSVTSIGAGAFKGCSSLVSISVPFVGASRTASNYSAVFGYIFGYVETSGSSWYTYCTGSDFANESYSISGTTWQFTCIPTTRYDSSSYPYHAKYYNYYIPSSITTVTITDATSIPTAAFNGCSNITSIVLNDEVTTIGNYAFQNCTKLESADVGTGLTTLNSYAFYNCSKLESVTIPYGVNSMGGYAFTGCSSLSINCQIEEQPSAWTSTWNSSSRPVTWGYGCERGTTAEGIKWISIDGETVRIVGYEGTATTLTIPTTIDGKVVNRIAANAFEGNTTLTSIVIPDGIIYIETKAFANMTNLVSVEISSTVTEIQANAFTGCTKVSVLCRASAKPSGWSSSWNSSNRPVVWKYAGAKNVTSDGLKWASVTGDTVVIYGYSGSSASVTIPTTINGKTVSGISENAFRSNTTITSVFIPTCIEYIGSGAFVGCSKLTINCEIASVPSGWSSSWKDSSTTVYWSM